MGAWNNEFLARLENIVIAGGGTVPLEAGMAWNQRVLRLLDEIEIVVDQMSSPLVFKGTWDADANSPALSSGVGSSGDIYIVSVAGTTDLDGETGWQPKDWAVFDGGFWTRVDNSTNPLVVGTRIIVGGGTVSASDTFIEATATGTLNLPASPQTGRKVYVKRNYSGADYTISGNGNTIDGAGSLLLTADKASVILIFDGAGEWGVL
jgi:hypothetical protein